MAPINGISIVQGEIAYLVSHLRRDLRHSKHTHDDQVHMENLFEDFAALKDALNAVENLSDLDAETFLSPFLEVITAKATMGRVTGLAVTSINKFLSYELINESTPNLTGVIEMIGVAVTHANFHGTDPGSNEAVLARILQVLRTLLVIPVGAHLSNATVYEIFKSCLHLCFEREVTELMRKTAEYQLMDMVQLLFARLPQLKDDLLTQQKLKAARRQQQQQEKQPAESASSNVTTAAVTNADSSASASAATAEPTASEKKRQETHHQQQQQVPASDQSVPDGASGGGVSGGGGSEFDTGSTPFIAKTFSDPLVSHAVVTQDRQQDSCCIEIGEPAPKATAELSAADQGEAAEEAAEFSATLAASSRDRTVSLTEPAGQDQVDAAEESIVAAPEASPSVDVAEQPAATIFETEAETEAEAEAEESGVLQPLLAEKSEQPGDQPAKDYVNPKGIRFTAESSDAETAAPQSEDVSNAAAGAAGPAASSTLGVANTKRQLGPYGLLSVREIFKQLIANMNPHDRSNTDAKMETCLNLLAQAFEVAADSLEKCDCLLELVRSDLCKNLVFLLYFSGTSVFAASLRLGYLIFSSLRWHLKFQLELYLTRLMEIVTSEGSRVSFDHRELALESLVQLWRVPGFVAEVYLNYDCDLYCSNLFKDITELLSKNAFSTGGGIFSTHLLSLDALLTVIDCIEAHCNAAAAVSATKASASQKQPQQQQQQSQQLSLTQASLTTGYQAASAQAVAAAPASTKSAMSSAMMSQTSVASADSCDVKELARRRERKKLLQQGADLFNRNPAKGLAFLGEHKLLYPSCPESVAAFLRENPSLDKKVLGEFISKKKLAPILRAFCRSFNFAGRRVDEALRDYLETFRLPGEAPLIQHVLEHFADHWHSANGHPFANEDAAYVLAYSVIMLNTDQHNANARKQNLPMTLDNFKRNLKGVNGGKDFDQDMLEAIYMTIKNDEIVMPSEQTGLVRDNYFWKLILRRGSTEQASFIRAPVGQLDLDLFNLIWGPTVAALSHVFDKTADEAIVVPKAISGFRKCAMISAHYGLTDVFDNIIISLCKFTGLLSSVESPDNIAVQFGGNIKAQLAAKTVCGLTHRHGDILREGWKNLLDCMLHLYKARLMPDSLVEVKDFIHPSGKIRLIKEETTNTNRQETGVFSSLYMSLFSDTSSSRAALSEELAARQRAAECIRECQLEQLVQDTKFLRMDSLSELVKDLIFAVQDNYQSRDLLSDGHSYAVLDEDACVFYFELLMQVLLQNRDRLGPLWSSVRSYFYNVLIGSTESSFLLERSIVGLIRLGHRLLHREDMSAQVFSCLRLLILAKPSILHSVCRQVVYGLHDLINTHAQSVHSEADWRILFALLEVCGAGALPSLVYRAEVASSLPEGFGPAVQQQQIGVEADLASSDGRASPASTNADRPSGRGYTSDSELYDANKRVGSGGGSGGDRDVRMDPSTGSWVLVDRDMSASAQDVSGPASSAGSSAGATAAAAAATVAAGTGGYDGQRSDSSPLVHQVMQNCPPVNQYSIALQEDLRHHDTKALVRACETLSFVIRDSAHVTPANFESCIHALRVFIEASLHGGRSRRRSFRSQLHQRMQLLDLMHTLHIRVATIFKSWSPQEKSSDCSVSCAYLWDTCWCPLLQGMARLCCDNRKPVRMQALTYLQRSLLFHDLRSLTPGQWEMCFNKVLFPLLSTLLEAPVNPSDPAGTEETRVRASTLLCKVFLMHLSPLLNLPTFTALWLTILDFMEKYIRADKSELLIEAIPESLKNMLLVMDNACILRQSRLWDLTWHRIGAFLPSLMEELFPQPKEAVA
uniref:SEC7 domain-containing protein n=1 Tax=Macrostomum lignano TaxID=282301 RepID=A0A1I8HMZ2_9PLAT